MLALVTILVYKIKTDLDVDLIQFKFLYKQTLYNKVVSDIYYTITQIFKN